jgi:DNA (cytosine-5)-methyltransferase 1
VPTLNAFDCGDTRATVVIVMIEREGKSGGGKGALLGTDKTFTLATSNFHILFIFEATRVEDVRIYENYCPTVARYYGTGGARVPYVYAIQGTVIGRQNQNGPQAKGFADDGEPMFTLDRVSGRAVAFDSYNHTVSDTNQTLRKGVGGIDHTGSILRNSQVRRLTPTECERLQGFPDGWTDGQADSHRYKQMGNAVAVPVVDWIIEGIVHTL